MTKIKISKPERLPREGVTDTDLNTWKNELFNYLNQEEEFELFLEDGRYATWTAKEFCAKRIQHAVAPDTEADLPKRQRQLHNYLTVIAGCAYKDHYMVILDQATSMNWIWEELKTVYQITSKGKDFLGIVDIKWDPTVSSATTIYNSYRAKIMENLKPAGTKVLWKNQTLTANESISPTFEDHILLSVLQLIDRRLPQKVKEVYGPRMEQGKLLMDFKMDILVNVTKLIQDIDIQDAQLNALSANAATPVGYIQPKFKKQPFKKPGHSPKKFCRLCHLARRPMHNVTSHEIGDTSCPSLSQRDREALQLKTTKLGAVEVEKEEDDDDLDAIAKQFGYDDDEQVDFSSSYFPKEGSKHESTVNTISYIKPVPSQILTVHDNMNIIHLDLDSGCWVSCAQLDYVKEKGWEILPNGQLTRLADNQTVLQSVGEIHKVFKRNNWTVIYRAIVLPQLHTPLIAGNNFIADNKITQHQQKQSITVHDKYTVPETNRNLPLPTHLNSVTAAVTPKLLLPQQSTTVKTTLPNNTTVLIEPRIESKSNWPEPQLKQVVNGKVELFNDSSEPVKINNKQLVNIRRVDQITPNQPQDYTITSTPNHNKIENFTINKNSMTHQQLKCMEATMMKYKSVFDKDLSMGYNQTAGRHKCALNWATATRPQADKVTVPIYNTGLNVLLQQVCDSLTEQGVLGIPQEDNILVQAISPCFLRKKQSAKLKANKDLLPEDVRLVVNTNHVSEHLKNLPTKTTKQQDVFLQIAKWKYIIKTDLYQGFFQNHLARSAFPYCAIQTPFGGLRYFKRSIQGLLGQSEELDELLSKILKDELMQGIVIKLADDLFIGGKDIDEATKNWQTVLQTLAKANIKLSPKKTVIFPESVDILSWVWNQGGELTPSPHRKQALSAVRSEDIKVVKDLRSWIGLFKTFLDCTPNLAYLLDPFDLATAGKDSGDLITWTPALLQAFNMAKMQIKNMVSLYLPNPNDQLIITADAARTPPGLGTVLQARDQEGNIRTVRHYSVKLKSNMQTWQPCEIEAAALGTAIEAFMGFIKESNKPVLLCTDSKPVVEAAKRILNGKFSLSPRIQTFLNNLSRIKCEIQHISGKTGHNQASDYASRNTFQCNSEICQICHYVNSIADSVIDPKAATLTPESNSLLNRTAWRDIQAKDKSCKAAITCLTTGQTPTRKKGPVNSETRRLTKMARVASDGVLVVDTPVPLSASKQEKIVVPYLHLPAILMQLHTKHGHPTKNQMGLVFNKHFFAYRSATAIDELYENCAICITMKRLPKQLDQYEVTTNAKKPGSNFGVDIIKRNKQLIMVARDQFSSYTVAEIVPNETGDSLREAIIKLITPIRSPDSVTIRTDNATGFQSIAKADPYLEKLDICLELSDPNNKNGNACIDKGIQELQQELLRIIPHDGLINNTNLALAVKRLNSKIRRQGSLSADEIMFSRDRIAGKNLNLNDTQLAQDQLTTRRKNNKENSQTAKKEDNLKPGDIIHQKEHKNKNKVRETYLVTACEKNKVEAQKILYPYGDNPTKLRSKTYSFKPNRVYTNKALSIRKTQPSNKPKLTSNWTPFRPNESETDTDSEDEDIPNESFHSVAEEETPPKATPPKHAVEPEKRKPSKEVWIVNKEQQISDLKRSFSARKIQRWFRANIHKQGKRKLRKRNPDISYKETLRAVTIEQEYIVSDISTHERESDVPDTEISKNESMEWDPYQEDYEDIMNEAFLTQPPPNLQLRPLQPIQEGRVYELPDTHYMSLDSPPSESCPTHSTPKSSKPPKVTQKGKSNIVKKFLFK